MVDEERIDVFSAETVSEIMKEVIKSGELK
jgi:hypothetical protein